jgi:hypothetical protein
MAGGVAQVVEYLLGKSEALSSNPSTVKKTPQFKFYMLFLTTTLLLLENIWQKMAFKSNNQGWRCGRIGRVTA